jgi:hypothetical protein
MSPRRVSQLGLLLRRQGVGEQQGSRCPRVLLVALGWIAAASNAQPGCQFARPLALGGPRAERELCSSCAGLAPASLAVLFWVGLFISDRKASEDQAQACIITTWPCQPLQHWKALDEGDRTGS